jgi:DMSO/TMAO reductase YedYZ molybdopterin-dependent catalytic subunit
MIVREREPLNLEMPFRTLGSLITPSERFFVRCHFPIPEIDVKTWRLKIEGSVEKPFALSYAELRQIESRTLTATLECAGNSRAFLTPQPKGTPWELGAVGNAEWTGVPLSAVLERAGMKAGAVDVIFAGSDQGEIEEPPRPAGEIQYARSVPCDKALKDVLLAYQMNGEELKPAHGFPVRVIVPGWYGMASVKWLERIIVSDTPFTGHFQTIDYAFWERRDGLPARVPITEMRFKAEIARPYIGEVVPAATAYRMHGATWTGDAHIVAVDISDDAGATWHAAKLLGSFVPNAWQLWEHTWQTPAQPGRRTLMARATDSCGHIQPSQHDADCGSYLVNHCLPIEVEAR